MAKRPAKPKPRPATKATPKKKGVRDESWHAKFLELFGYSMNVVLSAKGAGVDRATVYKHRKADPDFAAAMDEAKEEAVERLEADAYERAKKMSDTLLIFLLKAHKPQMYRENIQQQHTGGVEIVVKHVKTTKESRD